MEICHSYKVLGRRRGGVHVFLRDLTALVCGKRLERIGKFST